MGIQKRSFRYSRFAENVDIIKENTGDEIKLKILSGEIQSNAIEINQVANMEPSQQKSILKDADKSKSVKQALSDYNSMFPSNKPVLRAKIDYYEDDDDKLMKVKEIFKKEDFRHIDLHLTKNKRGIVMVDGIKVNDREVSSKLQLLDLIDKASLKNNNNSSTWSFEPDGIRVMHKNANIKYYIDHSVIECHLRPKR